MWEYAWEDGLGGGKPRPKKTQKELMVGVMNHGFMNVIIYISDLSIMDLLV